MTMSAGLHRFSRLERVYHGQPAAAVLPGELELLGSQRVFIISNQSLSSSRLLSTVRSALGTRLAGSYFGITAHAPRACVFEAAEAARAAGADLLLALGGGSVIDAAKLVALVIRFDYRQVDDLNPIANRREPDLGRLPADAQQWLRVLAIPTTFSGAEFASSAGSTDPRLRQKHGFAMPMMTPVSVVLDPAMTLETPTRLLLATGVKAIDHAIERITSAQANAYSDAVSLLALRKLLPALPRLRADVADLEARADAQYGMFMSLAGSAAGVAVNVSHAIGHVLGAHAGVPHGETSCVMSAATLKWSRSHTAERQQLIATAFEAAGEPGPVADVAQALTARVVSLGLPYRLRDVGVRREDFPVIAQKTLHEAVLRNSRKPVTTAATVEEILEIAW